MKMFIMVLTCLFTTVAMAAVPTKHFKGFVKINSGNELYVDWVRADEGQPTAVLLNGLTYSTTQWDRFTAGLVKQGIGVLRYDPIGMGQTLLKYAPIQQVIDYKDQVLDLESLLKTLKVPKPYNLVGLSYGGGIAFAFAAVYPGAVKKLIVMAPFTEPLQSQDQLIKMQVATARATQPWNPYTDDEIYDYFLHQNVYSSYPSAEPIVLENPYKLEAIFRMVQGIRHFRAERTLKLLPAKSVHLLIAANDQYIPRDVLDGFWDKIPEAVRASKTLILRSEHKIPEAVPRFSSAYVGEILRGNKVISGGVELAADPQTGVVSSEGGNLKLPKEQ